MIKSITPSIPQAFIAHLRKVRNLVLCAIALWGVILGFGWFAWLLLRGILDV